MAQQYQKQEKYRATPRGKFIRQKCNATRRGIPFLLTYEEWSNIWQISGHWEERGVKNGNYAMLRVGDTGPFTKENVFIGPVRRSYP